jgi:hypothetical protein
MLRTIIGLFPMKVNQQRGVVQRRSGETWRPGTLPVAPTTITVLLVKESRDFPGGFMGAAFSSGPGTCGRVP